MTRFTVPDMSCGHCTAAIEKAVKEADAQAKIDCNLEDHLVAISSELPAQALQSVIEKAGYSAQPV